MTSINRHIHALNQTLTNFFKGSSGKELVTLEIPSSSSVCQLCNMVGHSASMCSKSLTNQNVANVEGGIKEKIMDLNVFNVLVWGTLRSSVGRKVEEG